VKLEVLTEVLLKTHFFLNMMLCHWVCSSHCYKGSEWLVLQSSGNPRRMTWTFRHGRWRHRTLWKIGGHSPNDAVSHPVQHVCPCLSFIQLNATFFWYFCNQGLCQCLSLSFWCTQNVNGSWRLIAHTWICMLFELRPFNFTSRSISLY
jgi:hypothetical protein